VCRGGEVRAVTHSFDHPGRALRNVRLLRLSNDRTFKVVFQPVVGLVLPAALGLAIGLVIGALGGGGGVLTVPLLVYVLGLTAQGATTSSVVIVGITALFGAVARMRGGLVDWRTGLAFGAVGIPAAYLGTLVNRGADQRVLLLAFAGITVVAAVAMLLNRRPRGAAPDRSAGGPGTPVATATRPGAALATGVKVVAGGLIVGFLTGFLGVGGGFLVVPVLVIALRMEMPLAVGTSLLIITLNAVTALVARLGGPLDLDPRIVLPFTVLAVAGSLLGKRVADRFSGDALATAFAVLLILVGAFVAAESLGAF
jgi:uncharacterized protein